MSERTRADAFVRFALGRGCRSLVLALPLLGCLGLGRCGAIEPEETCESCMGEFDQELLVEEFGGDDSLLEEYKASSEYRSRLEDWREESCFDVCPEVNA